MSAGCVPVVSKISNNFEIVNKENGLLIDLEEQERSDLYKNIEKYLMIGPCLKNILKIVLKL